MRRFFATAMVDFVFRVMKRRRELSPPENYQIRLGVEGSGLGWVCRGEEVHLFPRLLGLSLGRRH